MQSRCLRRPILPPGRRFLRSTAQILWKCKLTKNLRRGGQVLWNTHLRKIVPASHLESALTISLDLKPPGMNTYKKHPGGPPLLCLLPSPCLHASVFPETAMLEFTLRCPPSPSSPSASFPNT